MLCIIIISLRLKNKLAMACFIRDLSGDEFIITGGYKEETGGTAEVSVYSKDGWQSDLASLNEPRFAHGCTSFIKEGTWVGINYKIKIVIVKRSFRTRRLTLGSDGLT